MLSSHKHRWFHTEFALENKHVVQSLSERFSSLSGKMHVTFSIILHFVTFYLIFLTSFYGITKHVTQAHQSGCYMKQDYTSNNGVLRLKVNSKYLKLDDINKEYQYLFLYLYRAYLIVLFFVPYSFRYSLG